MESLTVWRMCAAARAKTALSGGGASRSGGRWNLPGTRVIYCSESRALAALEILVHVEDLEDLAAVDWRVIAIEVPWNLVERPSRYPESWRTYPYSAATQRFGSAWAQARRSAVLRVPSAVMPGEFNYVLNPQHPEFGQLTVDAPKAFRFDPRLGKF